MDNHYTAEELANGFDKEVVSEMFKGMSLKDMAVRFVELKNEISAHEGTVSMLRREFDLLRKCAIPDKMDEAGITNVKFDGIGRVQVAADMYVSIPSGHQDDAYEWLRQNDSGDLIKDYVHPSTLKAFVKECIKKGIVLPDDSFKVVPFTRASVVK